MARVGASSETSAVMGPVVTQSSRAGGQKCWWSKQCVDWLLGRGPPRGRGKQLWCGQAAGPDGPSWEPVGGARRWLSPLRPERHHLCSSRPGRARLHTEVQPVPWGHPHDVYRALNMCWLRPKMNKAKRQPFRQLNWGRAPRRSEVSWRSGGSRQRWSEWPPLGRK